MSRIAVTCQAAQGERYARIVQTYGKLYRNDPEAAVRWLCVALRGSDTERTLREQILRASKPWSIILVITSYHA